MAADVIEKSLVEVAAAIASKDVSCLEVTDACLARAEVLQPILNCFISLEPEEARAQAKDADAALARGEFRGPLHGVPLAHKDLLYRPGKVMTCGSRVLGDFVADTMATVLERLERAGAVNLGTLNMAELALGASGRARARPPPMRAAARTLRH